MKLFVSTEKTQGQRETDFCCVPAGEILKFGVVCDGDMDNPDGDCGCSRSMTGTICHSATSTFEVADLDMTMDQLAQILLDSAIKAGFTGDRKRAKVNAKFLASEAARFSVGDIIERRGVDVLQKREQRP